MFSVPRGCRATVVVLCLIAAGCGAATTGSPAHKAAGPPVHAGDCFAKEASELGDVGPDFTSAIACTKPHIYEVSDAVAIPDRFLRGKTDKARLDNRKLLGSVEVSSRLTDDFHAYAQARCATATLKLAGISHVRIAGKSLTDVGAELSMGGAENWTNLSSSAAWLAGQRQFICMVRFTKHITDVGDVAPDPISAKSNHPAFYDFLRSDFPAVRRQCVTYDINLRYAVKPCTNQHYGEVFFSFDAARAFGDKFVRGIDPSNPTDAQMRKMSKPCFDALPELIGGNFDENLSADVDLGSEGWYEKSDVYSTYCMATPYDAEKFDLPPGSLVENPTKVAFVKIASGQGA